MESNRHMVCIYNMIYDEYEHIDELNRCNIDQNFLVQMLKNPLISP